MAGARRLSMGDLNEDQVKALASIRDFLSQADRRQMVLYGAAGTGKTSLINVLLDELDKDPDSPVYYCTAPTNKAVDVIAERTGRDFDRTIYSLLGLTLLDFTDGRPKLKKENESHLQDYDLVIVDEASMVSLALLNEIQRQLLIYTSIKVIYVGDRCQIPPVDDANNGMLKSIIFQLPWQVELTKVMRTAAENPILGAVTAMRADMKSPVDLFKHETAVAPDGTGIYFYPLQRPFMNKMLEYFKRDEFKEDSSYAMAVAYTNAAVDAINEQVRSVLYPDCTRTIEVGEEVRVVKTYGNNIVRGQSTFFSVLYNVEERLRVLEIEDVEDPSYHIKCYKVKVKNLVRKKAKQSTATAYIIAPEGMNDYLVQKEKLAVEAREKANALNARGHHIYTPREAWKEYSAFTKFYLWFGYIYALTAHKSQGSTIQNVFVVERNINRIPEAELRNKLKYTAFTRAAKELHVLK